MKIIKFIESWFDTDGAGNSNVKFAAGSFHPITEETERHVALGTAVVIDAPNDADKAEAVAEKAEAKVDDAVAAAEAARAASDAAAAAEQIATAPDPVA